MCGGTEAKLFQGLPNREVSGEIIVYFLRVELQDAFYPEIFSYELNEHLFGETV